MGMFRKPRCPAKMLLEHGTKPNKLRVGLVVAAEQGRLEVVGLLMKHNANPNKSRADGHSALRSAAGSGHFAVAKLLLQHNANPNLAKSRDGATPLLIAGEGGHGEIMHFCWNLTLTLILQRLILVLHCRTKRFDRVRQSSVGEKC